MYPCLKKCIITYTINALKVQDIEEIKEKRKRGEGKEGKGKDMQ